MMGTPFTRRVVLVITFFANLYGSIADTLASHLATHLVTTNASTLPSSTDQLFDSLYYNMYDDSTLVRQHDRENEYDINVTCCGSNFVQREYKIPNLYLSAFRDFDFGHGTQIGSSTECVKFTNHHDDQHGPRENHSFEQNTVSCHSNVTASVGTRTFREWPCLVKNCTLRANKTQTIKCPLGKLFVMFE